MCFIDNCSRYYTDYMCDDELCHLLMLVFRHADILVLHRCGHTGKKAQENVCFICEYMNIVSRALNGKVGKYCT